MLSVLYDTGARVQECVDVTLDHLRLDGQGRPRRTRLELITYNAREVSDPVAIAPDDLSVLRDARHNCKSDETGDAIYNGALDNGVAMAQALAVAGAFAELPERPRRL